MEIAEPLESARSLLAEGASTPHTPRRIQGLVEEAHAKVTMQVRGAHGKWVFFKALCAQAFVCCW